MKDVINVSFDMKQQMCNDCKKISDEYYELKLQIRFSFFEDVKTIKKEVMNLVNLIGFINKIIELDNGFDVFFRNKHVLNKVSSIFNDKYLIEEKRTKKIVGRNFLESKDIWRHILLINIINLKINDIVNIKGVKYRIKALNKKDLVLINLEDSSKKVVSYEIVKDYLSIEK